MQDTLPFIDPVRTLSALAREVFPDFDARIPELYREYGPQGCALGWSDGTWTLHRGWGVNDHDKLIIRFMGEVVQVDTWGQVYRYKEQPGPILQHLLNTVADVIRDIISEEEAKHVMAQDHDLP